MLVFATIVKRSTSNAQVSPFVRYERFVKPAVGHEVVIASARPTLNWVVRGLVNSRSGCLFSSITPGYSVSSCYTQLKYVVVCQPVVETDIIQCRYEDAYIRFTDRTALLFVSLGQELSRSYRESNYTAPGKTAPRREK